MSEGSLSPEKFAADIEEAKEKFDVIQSSETTLLIDIDSPAAISQFEKSLPKVKELFGVVSVEHWISKSGNEHALITLTEKLPIATRIALQAALGSDGIREILALKRMMNGIAEPSLLFKPKQIK